MYLPSVPFQGVTRFLVIKPRVLIKFGVLPDFLGVLPDFGLVLPDLGCYQISVFGYMMYRRRYRWRYDQISGGTDDEFSRFCHLHLYITFILKYLWIGSIKPLRFLGCSSENCFVLRGQPHGHQLLSRAGLLQVFATQVTIEPIRTTTVYPEGEGACAPHSSCISGPRGIRTVLIVERSVKQLLKQTSRSEKRNELR